MTAKRVGTLVAAVGIALAAPGSAHAAVSFSSTPYPLPAADSAYHSRLGAVAIVDLNNDGRPDIVVYRGGGNLGKVLVLLNQGGGTFAPAQAYAACGNPDGGTMVTGQFNAGQAADVILGCEAGGGFDELLGNGDGTLGGASHFSNIGLHNVLALWPADDGGFPNLLYGIYSSAPPATISLTYNPVNALDPGSAVALPDTSDSAPNGDPNGHASISPALATAHFYSQPTCPRDDVILSPYLRAVRAWGLNPFGNPAPGGLGPCQSFAYTERAVQGIPAGENLARISATDLSGDGSPDLLMTTDRSLVALIWQTGGGDLTGGFPPGQQSVVTASILGIEDQYVADFDGDGHPDAAVVGESNPDPTLVTGTTGTLAIHLGHGDGSFDTPPLTFAVPGGAPDGYNTIGPNHLAVGDLNGDGRPDVVSIAQYDGSVTVLLNTTPAPTPAPAVGGGSTGSGDTVVPSTGAGPSGSSAPAGGSPSAGTASLGTTTVTLSPAGRGLLALTCRGSGPCAGTYQIAATGAQAAGNEKARRRPRTVVLASGAYSIPAGRTGSVSVSLNAKGKALLRKHRGALRTTLTLAPTGGAATSAPLRLKQAKSAPKRKH